MMPPLLPHQRIARWAIAAGFLVSAVFLYFKPDGAGLPCVFRAATGIPCAFCGGTRSACAMLQGDFARAFELNAFAAAVVLLGALVACICLLEALRGRAFRDWSAAAVRWKKFFPLAGAAVLLWWIPHLWLALRGEGNGLADRSHPVATRVAGWLGFGP